MESSIHLKYKFVFRIRVDILTPWSVLLAFELIFLAPGSIEI